MRTSGSQGSTLAAVISAVAALLTAVTGLLAFLDARGVANPFGGAEPERVTVEGNGTPTTSAGGTTTTERVTTSTSSSTPEQTEISPEDCLSYNVAGLKIVNEGASGFLLTDGRSRMLILDDQTDADNALALARRHTKHCFIGRDNNRPNRKDYIVEYWEGSTGNVTTISPEDCLPYNVAGLKIVNEGASGFLLTDGRSRMLILDDQTDADNALVLARRHTKHCFIGRDNNRPNRKDYIVDYWR